MAPDLSSSMKGKYPLMQGSLTPDGTVRTERMNHFNAYYNAVGERWCGRGKHWEDCENFHANAQWCKVCRSAYFKETYDPEKARRRNFRYYYKHDDLIYDRLFEQQKGVCAICGKPPDLQPHGCKRTQKAILSTDHDHKTGRVRGLLCRNCNLAVGWMRDNPTLIEEIHAYVEKEPPTFEL